MAELTREDMLALLDGIGAAIADELSVYADDIDRDEVGREAAHYVLQWLLDGGYITSEDQ